MRTAAIMALTATLASASYDENIAMRAMYFSGASYCAKSTINPWNCGEPCNVHSGVSEITMVENELLDTFGIVAYN